MLSAKANSNAVLRSARRSSIIATALVLHAMLLCLWLIDTSVDRELRAQITEDLTVMRHDAEVDGITGLANLIVSVTHDRPRAERRFALAMPDGRLVAGNVADPPVWAGWSHRRETGRFGTPVLLLTAPLPDGTFLTVGRAMRVREIVNRALLLALPLTALAQIMASALLGFLAHRVLRRQLEAMDDAMGRFAEGDLTARVPREADDGDRIGELAGHINVALERIQILIGTVQRTASAIAHDLRKPLTKASFSIECALRRDVPSEVVAHLRDAEVELFKMASASSAILRLAEIEGGSVGIERFDLAALVREVCETYEPVLEDQGGSLSLHLPEEPLHVRGDRGLLGQVMVNLIENTLRHCPPPVGVTLTVIEDGRTVSLSVEDDGPGVLAEDRERIFDAFHRVDQSRSTDGTGLGLALVRAVVERHHGRVIAGSAEPGLRVTLRMPILAESE